MRGAGLSLKEALSVTEYALLRKSFGPPDLLPLIEARPGSCEEWLGYSRDKRTSEGWYLSEKYQVGRAGSDEEPIQFNSLEQAVAEYVVRELDFWAAVSETA